MFLFWTHAGAVVLLLGFLMIGLTIGSFDFADIQESEIPQDIVMASAIAIAIGLGVKLAVFMFHIWLPYVHGSAPTPISALLSPAMIGIGAYGIFRLIVEFLPSTTITCLFKYQPDGLHPIWYRFYVGPWIGRS
jgi:NADH-quinone oxidoreductase subunit M